MADAAAEAVTAALLEHRPRRTFRSLMPESIPDQCTCGARDLADGDRREAHLADVAVAALTQAGLLGVQPITYRAGAPIPAGAVVTVSNAMPDVRWRAAALGVVAAWTHQPIPGTDVAAVQQEDLEHRWPTLGAAIRRLVQAKAQLLEGAP